MLDSREMDAERLDVLRAVGLLDAGRVTPLDRLTGLAARLLGAAASMMSVIDTQRQTFVSSIGLPRELEEQGELPLSHSFCKHVVESGAPLIVPDTRLDEQVRDNPSIVEHDVIAYAGFPLRSPDGDLVGSFCVFDRRPRQWTDDELATLSDLAAVAESEIALRIAHNEQLVVADRMQAVLDSAHDAFVSIDADGAVIGWNASAEQLFGYTSDEATGRPVHELIIPQRYHAMHRAGLARARSTGQSMIVGQRLQLSVLDRNGREFPAEMMLQGGSERGRRIFHAFVHDVTDRMVAFAELERQRQELDDEHTFLQTLLDSLPASVAACDSKGRLTFFNRALREVCGRDAERGESEETWAQACDVYAPDGRTPLGPDEIPLARAHAGEIVLGQQMIINSPALGPRRFVSNARPIDTPDGRRLGAVVAMNDITDLHRVEQLRRARHAVAQVLSEATNAEEAAIRAVAAITDALGWLCGEYWRVDEDRRNIDQVSSHAADGHDLSAFTGARPLTYLRGDGLPGSAWKQTNSEVWYKNIPDELLAGERLEGARRIGIHTAVGLPVRSGRRVIGVLAFYTDDELDHDPEIAAMLDAVGAHLGRFVERRRAEDLTLALSAARRDFDRVVGQLNDYVWTVELVPGDTTRLVYGSPNATGVFGGLPPEPSDQAGIITDRTLAEDGAALTAFHATLRSGEPAELECRIVGYDEVVRWVWTRAVPRQEDGRLFIDGISTNTTERRELAEQRERQMEQLREIDRMKDELAALVIHELRNPIGVIRGYAEMLVDNPGLDAVAHQHAEVVDRTGLHLQGLVDDLLDLARLDAGHISIDPRPMPVGRLMRDVLENHRPSAWGKKLCITEQLDSNLPVLGDAQRLRQALDNLLSNAIKYTPEGGTITVVAERRGDSVVIEISDTGIGIPAEQYQHLFSRFFRASNATSKGIKGTGLGLAVTKAIADAHHGAIEARPATGGGTTFSLTLPRHTLPEATPPSGTV